MKRTLFLALSLTLLVTACGQQGAAQPGAPGKPAQAPTSGNWGAVMQMLVDSCTTYYLPTFQVQNAAAVSAATAGCQCYYNAAQGAYPNYSDYYNGGWQIYQSQIMTNGIYASCLYKNMPQLGSGGCNSCGY